MKLIKTLLGVTMVASGFFAFAHQKQSAVDKYHDQMISPLGDGDAPDAPMRYLLGVTRKNI